MEDTRITDYGLSEISCLEQLRIVNLKGCPEISDIGVAFISELCHLENLNLCGLRKISDNGIRHLRKLENLKEFILLACPNITDISIEYLLNCPLTEFSIGTKKITKQGLYHLFNMSKLSSLWLLDCNKLTDDDFQNISNLSHLSTFYLMGKLLSNSIFTHLSTCASLREITIFSDKITNDYINNLPQKTNIEKINVFSSKMSNCSFEPLNLYPNTTFMVNGRHVRFSTPESINEKIVKSIDAFNTKSGGEIIPPEVKEKLSFTGSQDDGIIDNTNSQTMKDLRQELKKMIKQLREFIKLPGATAYTPNDISSFQIILETYLNSISGKKNNKIVLINATKKAVLDLNKLDAKTDHGLIETELRETLSEFFDNCSIYVGFKTNSIADRWRNW